MIERTVQLHRNLPPLLQRFSVEELYTVAQCLANECQRRDLDARLEARALEAALLVLARQEHRARLVTDAVELADELRSFWQLGDGGGLI